MEIMVVMEDLIPREWDMSKIKELLLNQTILMLEKLRHAKSKEDLIRLQVFQVQKGAQEFKMPWWAIQLELELMLEDGVIILLEYFLIVEHH